MAEWWSPGEGVTQSHEWQKRMPPAVFTIICCLPFDLFRADYAAAASNGMAIRRGYYDAFSFSPSR